MTSKHKYIWNNSSTGYLIINSPVLPIKKKFELLNKSSFLYMKILVNVDQFLHQSCPNTIPK